MSGFLSISFIKMKKKDYSLAKKFMIYAAQFHPNYIWTKFDLNNPVDSVILECFINDYTFKTNYFDSKNKDIKKQKALSFGEIVTEFLIRFLNYSLIKCQNQNIIVTAQSNCDKQFGDLLYQGYSLQRMAKVGYQKLNHDLKKYYPNTDGFFYTLPVLPTKEIGFYINELIETKNTYQKIL